MSFPVPKRVAGALCLFPFVQSLPSPTLPLPLPLPLPTTGRAPSSAASVFGAASGGDRGPWMAAWFSTSPTPPAFSSLPSAAAGLAPPPPPSPPWSWGKADVRLSTATAASSGGDEAVVQEGRCPSGYVGENTASPPAV